MSLGSSPSQAVKEWLTEAICCTRRYKPADRREFERLKEALARKQEEVRQLQAQCKSLDNSSPHTWRPAMVANAVMPPPLMVVTDFAGVAPSALAGVHLCTGRLRYYHYGADGADDRGWGCGYRTVQTMLSWLSESAPPSLPELQSVLKANGVGVGGSAWIGVQEAVILLDVLHSAVVEVLPLSSGGELLQHLPRLSQHFDGGGGPVMIGGGTDVYSKTLVGVRHSRDGPEAAELLILDPHYFGCEAIEGDVAALNAGGWAAWKPASVLMARSFYNLALPRAPPPETERIASLAAPTPLMAASAWAGIEVVEGGTAA